MKVVTGSPARNLMLLCGLAAALPVHAGISYRVTAVTETTTVVMPGPAADMNRPETPEADLSRPARPEAPAPKPRRTVSRPSRITAEVFLEGQNIRINNFRLDDGRRGGTQNSSWEIYLSRDGGASFEVVDVRTNTRRPFPLEVSFNPAVMMIRPLTTEVALQSSNLRVLPPSETDGGAVGGYRTRRHGIRATFDLEADPRLRRDKMKVTSDHQVWTTTAIGERVPPGFHAWATGLPAVDMAIREQMARVDGFPVQSVTRLLMESGLTQLTTVTRLEVTAIRFDTFDKSLFEPGVSETPKTRRIE